MKKNQLANIEQLEAHLWDAADNLRANSKLTAGEYCMPVLGVIFLMKFAMQGAQDNGEFFTPPSLVQTIVNVIEPDHGIVCDLACGSCGMFVQTSHFIEQRGQSAAHRVTFFGQEYKTINLRLAKMNLAVHGLEGDIVEANTFYQDIHELYGKCDFVMANPRSMWTRWMPRWRLTAACRSDCQA